MADLEDRILKKNIPGKYTWWEKDSDEEGEKARADYLDPDASDPEAELTEFQKQQKWVENECPEPVRRTIVARQERERARTGVKGVLADYKAWKASADAEDTLAAEYRKAALQRMAQGARIETVAREKDMIPGTMARNASSDEEDDEEESFLEAFRELRLKQLKASVGRPQFGQIREVERGDFVAAVDTEDPRTCVVVHLYEPYIGACQRMNRHLEVLAKQQAAVKFLRLRSSCAENGFDPVALPTLLIYRSGDVVGCVTRVTDDLGEGFTREDVEWLLQEHDVFEATAKATGGEGGDAHCTVVQSLAKQGILTDDEDEGSM